MCSHATRLARWVSVCTGGATVMIVAALVCPPEANAQSNYCYRLRCNSLQKCEPHQTSSGGDTCCDAPCHITQDNKIVCVCGSWCSRACGANIPDCSFCSTVAAAGSATFEYTAAANSTLSQDHVLAALVLQMVSKRMTVPVRATIVNGTTNASATTDRTFAYRAVITPDTDQVAIQFVFSVVPGAEEDMDKSLAGPLELPEPMILTIAKDGFSTWEHLPPSIAKTIAEMPAPETCTSGE